MKTNFKIIIAAIAIVFTAVSCGSGSSVDAALAQIEKTMDKVEKNKTSMTEADWKALGQELEQPLHTLNEALENDKVSALKKLKISATMLRYVAVAGEAALRTVADSLKLQMDETHFGDSISIAVDKLHEAFDSEEMKQAMEELQKAAAELEKLGVK